MTDDNQSMTFDELVELYRKEMDKSPLTPARGDLYRAMADADVDAEHKRQADRLRREIARIRATKICNMAFLGALGSKDHVEALATPEELEYYRGVQDLTRRMLDAPGAETAQGKGEKVRDMDLDETEMEILMASPECKGRTASDAVNRAVYVYNLLGELMSYYPRQDRTPSAPSEDRKPADAQEPRYDPGRPTEDDVGKVREAMRQIWSTVKYLADRTGLEQYVVRRACKELVKGGEAAWKETNGTLQFMRAPRAVQAKLPEPREARTMYAPRIREYLDDGAWRTTPQIVRALGLEGDKGGWRKAYDALCRLALDGDLERYPPTMPGRHARASQVEWRLKPWEGSE